MSRETNMTVGRPTKLILGLAVPLILTNVGQQLYTVADASIVGRGVGVEALAALGANWFGHPSDSMCMIGITGTNGKTTST